MKIFGNLKSKTLEVFKRINPFLLTIGILPTLLVVNPLTRLIFQKSFFGRNLPYKAAFFLVWYFGIVFFLHLVAPTIARVSWVKKIKNQIHSVANSWFTRVKTDPSLRITLFLAMLGAGVTLIFAANHVILNIDTDLWKYVARQTLPIMTPIGVDFRNGWFSPAENLFVGKSLGEIWQNTINTNGYPPFVTLLGLLFLPFGANTGYLIQATLLLMANIASIAIAVGLCRKYILIHIGLDDITTNLISGFIFFAILLYTFSSYGFAFSIERANYDIYAIIFSLFFLRLFITKPEKLWPQIILLSIATHLKIYPAILFLLLFKQHAWKMVLPAVLVNALFLFILGPNNAFAFLVSNQSAFGFGTRFASILNHSSYAFASKLIENTFPNLANAFLPVWVFFTLVPVFIWGVATARLFKTKITPEAALLFFAICVPLMSFVPTVSHDYKLVIFSSAIVVLLCTLLKNVTIAPKLSDYLQLVFLMFILIFIGRSYMYDGFLNIFILKNKYLWVLALEILMVFAIFRKNSVDKIDETNSNKILKSNHPT